MYCRVSTMHIPSNLCFECNSGLSTRPNVKAIVEHVQSLLVSVQHDLALSGRELERGPIRQFPFVRLYVSKSGGHPEVDVWRARHLAVIGAQRGIDLLRRCQPPAKTPSTGQRFARYLQSCSFVLPWRLAGRACSAGHPSSSSCRFHELHGAP